MRAALARREREGLSWAALSEATGVPLSTLQWWKRKLADAEVDRGMSQTSCRDTGFVELLVRGDETEGQIGCFELVLSSGAVIRIPQRFDSDSLVELLAVLERHRC